VGVGVLAISPFIRRLMHLDALRDTDVGDDLEGQSQAGIEAHEAGFHPTTRAS
jgi:POT family proton-dependent oligopeptide transporter